METIRPPFTFHVLGFMYQEGEAHVSNNPFTPPRLYS